MKLLGFSALALAITAFAVGCAASTPEDDAVNAGASEDLTAAAATSVLDGTFNLKGSTEETPFHTITLNADHSFVAMGGCHGSAGGHPVCFAIVRITGSWKTQKDSATGAPQIALKDQSDQETAWFYSLKNDTLSLAKTKSGTATKFDKDLSHLPKPKSMDVCADKFGNTLGFCSDDFPCLEDTTDSSGKSRCLPPI